MSRKKQKEKWMEKLFSNFSNRSGEAKATKQMQIREK